MSHPSHLPVLTARPPLRGPGTQADFERAGTSATLQWTSGATPAAGSLEFAVNDDEPWPVIIPGAYLEVRGYGRTFFGVCQRGPFVSADGVAPTGHGSGGKSLAVEFVDTRQYLHQDLVYGYWNRIVKIRSEGRWRRWFETLAPSRWRANARVWTPWPLPAGSILGAIIHAPTVETRWRITSHPDLWRYPVYNLDSDGKTVAQLMTEIAEQLGLTFTLAPDEPLRLVWYRRGEGAPPAFPARSDGRALQTVLSGQPTRVVVTGGRNLYVVLNVPMTPDWNAAWEEFRGAPGQFIESIFNLACAPGTNTRLNAIPGDTEQVQGYQLASVIARIITVREYAALRGDVNFLDHRWFNGRLRADLPAMVYLAEIVWRAWRPPPVLTVNGVTGQTRDMRLVADLPVEISHDPVTGAMSAARTASGGGNGYAIARGYDAGADWFAGLNPDRFRLEDWLGHLDLWKTVPFQIDDSADVDGQFIIFDAPLVLAPDLVKVTDGYAHLDAAAAISTPPVRAALAFEWDPFFFPWPPAAATRLDAGLHAPALRAEYLVDGPAVTEIPFEDGETAAIKARRLAEPVLAQPYTITQGRYRLALLPGDTLPDVNGAVSRVGLEIGPGGHVGHVDFSNERPARRYTPPPELDRLNRAQPLARGEAELKEEARRLRLDAAVLRAQPRWAKTLGEALHGRLGLKEARHKERVEP